MKNVSFGSLKKGEKFFVKGQAFIKTDKVRISCCRFNNAVDAAVPTRKLSFKDADVVQVQDGEEAK